MGMLNKVRRDKARDEHRLGIAFILSHPDYNRRLWNLTRSADLRRI